MSVVENSVRNCDGVVLLIDWTMKASRAVKKSLLYDLWDRFAEEERIKCSNLNNLNWELNKAKKWHKKEKIERLIDAAPKSNLTMEQIYTLTDDDRDHYIESYFEMRLIDY